MKYYIISLSVFIAFFINQAHAIFSVSKVNLVCNSDVICEEYDNLFKSLERQYNDIKHFRQVLKLFITNEGISTFNYSLIKKDNSIILSVDFKPKRKIVSILPLEVISDYDIEFPSLLIIREGDFYDSRKISQVSKTLRDIAKEKGFPDAKVLKHVEQVEGGYELKLSIKLNRPIKVERININSSSEYLSKIAHSKLGSYVETPYNLPQIKIDTEKLKILFHELGYYLVDPNLKYRFINKHKVELFLDISNPKQVAFNIKNNRYFSNKEIKDELAKSMISTKREFSNDNIELILKEKYEKAGFKFLSLDTEKRTFKTKNQDQMLSYSISIKENVRSRVQRISFKGNTFFTRKQLRTLFYERAFDQASVDIYDPEYYKSFTNLIRELYIKNGYVSVFVDQPFIQFDSKTKEVNISFRIREGLRSFVSEVNVNGVDIDTKLELLKLLDTRVGSPFNPVEFKENLEKCNRLLKDRGFYYSKLYKSKDLVLYDSDNTEVKINLNFNQGPKVFAGDIIIVGNYKTRKRLIKREITFKRGNLITSKNLSASKSNLMALGIFSSVSIRPIAGSGNETDILVYVREKDFGTFEIAPGVRSDLGLKLSTNLTYNNIDGLNKRVSLVSTFNRRFDLFALDDERREKGEKLIEYDVSLTFSEKKILRSNYDFSMSLSGARRRFFSFDADIQRFSYTVSQSFNSWFSASISQQIEQISQFNATDEINEGNFRVGSITPSLSFDFRDRAVNPSKGALFELSYELANPTFGSQEVDGESIDYYKVITRNRFYIPLGDYWIFAMSTAFGLQENNLGDEGYIPSIKVFRLLGADIVRGYEDFEINRLISGEDISENNINSRAYMANIKLEPRYYLSDSTILGVFYDAGRVFVDEFQGDQLRSSAGITFKYITPVGTLDFDYGIKLLRKRDSSGNLESPGRLHVSIGFF